MDGSRHRNEIALVMGNPIDMYQSLISDGDEDVKEIKEMMDYDCFNNMMDAKYEKCNPVDVAKLQTHLLLSQ
jgi:hypothetical protein